MLISRIIRDISNHVLFSSIVFDSIDTPSVLSVYSSTVGVNKNAVMITRFSDAPDNFDDILGSEITFFITDTKERDLSSIRKDYLPNRMNIIYLDMEFAQAHNHINAILTTQNTLETLSDYAGITKKTNTELIVSILNALGGYAAVTDDHYAIKYETSLYDKNNYSWNPDSGSILRILDPEEFNTFLANSHSMTDVFEFRSKHFLYVFKIMEKDCLVGLFINVSEEYTASFLSRFRIVGDYIRKTLLYAGSIVSQSQNKLGKFIARLMNGELTKLADIKANLSSLDYPISTYYFIVVIDFNQNLERLPYRYIVNELKEIFPEQNIGTYENKLIVLLTSEQFMIKPKIKYKRLSELLQKYNGYAGITTNISNWFHIKMVYQFAVELINVVTLMPDCPKNRIILQQYYMTYLVFNICFQSFQHLYGHSNIVYIAHPSIIALLSYDKRTGDNLLNVLKEYLNNNQNVSLTASALYMHRNTLSNKLKKIKQITGDDISHPEVIFQYQLSFLLLNFYEQCKKQDNHTKLGSKIMPLLEEDMQCPLSE